VIRPWHRDGGFSPQGAAAELHSRRPELIAQLRRSGRHRGLLVEALSRLEQEDPGWRAEFERLYGPGLGSGGGDDDGEYVSAAPGPDFGPED
jgi:hypothetical protein